ncbi:hypothetical protein GWI34_44700, partial [Actinomadura sp. DSM 109109]|nr:hypothetical protein [Actinomadura lepetitiana]
MITVIESIRVCQPSPATRIRGISTGYTLPRGGTEGAERRNIMKLSSFRLLSGLLVAGVAAACGSAAPGGEQVIVVVQGGDGGGSGSGGGSGGSSGGSGGGKVGDASHGGSSGGSSGGVAADGSVVMPPPAEAGAASGLP